MAGQRVLAVAGTHGKTTTTGLLTSALLAAGADPTYAVGGVLHRHRPQRRRRRRRPVRRRGRRERRRLPRLPPHAAIVTNVEADHLDNWGTEEAYHAAFDEFADTHRPRRLPRLRAPTTRAPRALAATRACRGLEVITVGESRRRRPARSSTSRSTAATSTCRVVARRRRPGRAAAADPRSALRPRRGRRARRRGCGSASPSTRWPTGSAGFTGTGRRMELKGEAAGVRVYDSYAHHPVEIAGDLRAARSRGRRRPGRRRLPAPPRLPHPHLRRAMGEALGAADEVVVLDVYLAREDADPAVTGALVADAVPLPAEQVAFVPDFDAVPGRARRPRPARRPRAHPRRRQHHRASGRAVLDAARRSAMR